MGREEVQSKIDFVQASLVKLEEIPQANYEDFASDSRNIDSTLYRLQTTIQGLMDMGSYLCAALGLPAPSYSRDVLQSLETAGCLPANSADRFGPLFAFRNRVVHLHDRIDPKVVYRILTEERRDLQELLAHSLAALEKLGE